MRRLTALCTALLTVVLTGGCDLKRPDDGSYYTVGEFEGDTIEEQMEKEKVIVERLKSDKSEIFDLAEKSVRDGIAEAEGNEAAKSAVIEIDKASLRSFGPKRWTVNGTLKRIDKNGEPLETKWEVVVHVMFGQIAASAAKFDGK